METQQIIEGIYFHLGQKWKETDSRFNRIVEVVGFDLTLDNQRIKVVTVYEAGTVGLVKIPRWNKIAAFKKIKGKKQRYSPVEPIVVKENEKIAQQAAASLGVSSEPQEVDQEHE